MTERRIILLTTLVATMTASSFQIFAVAVLAVDLIADLNISRTGLGLIGSLNTLVGALTAPATGRFTDRIGPGPAIIIVMVISGVGMAMMAGSTNWILLAGSALVCGIPQGWGNPATNALIAERVPADARGTVTGIKQSGVQLGIFMSGLTLPGLALIMGWRGAVGAYAAVFLLGAAVMAWQVRRPEPVASTPRIEADAGPPATTTRPDDAGNGRDDEIPGVIWAISGYAFLLGCAGGAIGRFFPLWANEVVGLSTVAAGVLVAVGGLLGIGARIVAGRLAQDRIAPTDLLAILALVGALYCGSLIVTTSVGSWVLWPGTLLSAVGIGAWNAVAMLAVIVLAPKAVAGRASGITMVGFLGGLSVSSPIAGAVVDRWNSYQPVWIGSLLFCLAGAAIISPRLRPVRQPQPNIQVQ